MARRLSSRQSLWLLSVLPRPSFTLQSCSLSRLYRAATAFGLGALLLSCRRLSSSPSFFSSFKHHISFFHTLIQPLDIPRVVVVCLSDRLCAHLCFVDEPKDVCDGLFSKQNLQVNYISPCVDWDLLRVQAPQHGVSLSPPLPAMQQEMGNCLAAPTTPPALCILDLSYP